MAKKTEVLGLLYGFVKLLPAPPARPGSEGEEAFAELLDGYADALKDFPVEAIAGAMAHVQNTWEQGFGILFPPFKRFRDACMLVSGELAQLPSRYEAWEEARAAAFRIGARKQPGEEDFSHALVLRAAVQAGGSWRRFCLSDEEASLRARYLQAYEDLSRRELEQQSLPASHRHLTAAEARYQLDEVNRRKAKLLPAGESEPMTRISEIDRSMRLEFRGEVAQMSAEEWEARMATLREQAAEVAG